jgi:NAD(P)-dependent dehydrogenase (short-subunit alcohol dehydrogenase family)
MTTEKTEKSMPKIAIVTGGSRGRGRSTVLSLAKRGVRSIFTYRSNRAGADKIVAAAGITGAKAIALQLDTGIIGAFAPFVQSVHQALLELGSDRFDALAEGLFNEQNEVRDSPRLLRAAEVLQKEERFL